MVRGVQADVPHLQAVGDAGVAQHAGVVGAVAELAEEVAFEAVEVEPVEVAEQGGIVTRTFRARIVRRPAGVSTRTVACRAPSRSVDTTRLFSSTSSPSSVRAFRYSSLLSRREVLTKPIWRLRRMSDPKFFITYRVG
nr:hypothetical protein GCM10025730_53470 [Promicromonospora thailandica]